MSGGDTGTISGAPWEGQPRRSDGSGTNDASLGLRAGDYCPFRVCDGVVVAVPNSTNLECPSCGTRYNPYKFPFDVWGY
eukprot:g68529.t1